MRLTFREKKSKKTKDQKEEIPDFAKSPKGFIFELLKIFLIALVIVIPIRYFLFQPFYVRGASMEPSFNDNEYLIIDEITYRFTEPKRGEVVVIKSLGYDSDYLIKRVIGLPGETLEIDKGQVIIFNNDHEDGFALDERYLFEGMRTSGNQTVTLGSDEYFVMGDNRSVSLDSRSFGPLPKENIIGKAWLRVWPFDKIKHFNIPLYN